jgi:hypothetical protein
MTATSIRWGLAAVATLLAQRFDAALVVPEPFDPTGLIGYQLLPGNRTR